jgi:hypothetical protein
MLRCVGQESCGGILVRWPDLKLFDASQQARAVPVLMALGLREAARFATGPNVKKRFKHDIRESDRDGRR